MELLVRLTAVSRRGGGGFFMPAKFWQAQERAYLT